MSELKRKYEQEIRPQLLKELGLKNIMEVPKLEKIVVNMGLGNVRDDPKILENAAKQLAMITGQKPIVTKAKKSIAGFKIRKGWSIGLKVTLRGKRMYDFFEKLINFSIPRIRDFRGLSPHSFDGRGNYSLGIKEQIVFPEIDYDDIDKIRGMDICIVTTAKDDEKGYALLKALGMPFKR